jgi:hypothetical protein
MGYIAQSGLVIGSGFGHGDSLAHFRHLLKPQGARNFPGTNNRPIPVLANGPEATILDGQ